MLHRSEPTVTRETFVWQPKIDGLVRDVPMDILVHKDALTGMDNQIHFYGGLGEERYSIKRGIRKLGEMGLPAVGSVLQFHTLEANDANIERTIIEAPLAVAAYYNEKAGKPADAKIDSMGHSQGGGVALYTAINSPDAYDSIAAWEPVGLTGDAFKGTDRQKRNEFLKRLVIKNNLQPEQTLVRHPSLVVGAYEAGKRATIDFFHKEPSGERRLDAKLGFALKWAIGADVAEYAKTHEVAIFAGDTDPLFRLEEYKDALGTVNALHLLHEMPGSHTNISSGSSDNQMRRVADWMNGVRWARKVTAS